MTIYWRSSGFIAGVRAPIIGSVPYAVGYSADNDNELHEVAYIVKRGFFFTKPFFDVEFVSGRHTLSTLEAAKEYVVKHYNTQR